MMGISIIILGLLCAGGLLALVLVVVVVWMESRKDNRIE
jgi:hypothetical protein